MSGRSRVGVLALLAVWTVGASSAFAAPPAPGAGGPAPGGSPAPDARGRSELHYRSGVALFEAGNREQALVEFQLAHELFPSHQIVFMFAQCEYHMGRLKAARQHYEEYLAQESQGTLADTARVRIAAIARRPGTIVVSAVPDAVSVVIEGSGLRIVGEGPNEFEVPRGRYRVSVSKTHYQTQSREFEIDVAETRPLFFKLEPVPALLSIKTDPPDATLFVRGMRAENPYAQSVEPGRYEIYAESVNHKSRRETVVLGAGEARTVGFKLTYVQRSGRPELIAFWSVAGAIGAAGATSVVLQAGLDPTPIEGINTVLLGAAAMGGVTGGLLANALAPAYLEDNLALFRIGAMWIGAVEGAGAGMLIHDDPGAAFLGGVGGLTLGAVAGAWADRVSPRYGRVAMIQSGAGTGLLAGLLAVPALGLDTTNKHAFQIAGLVGLNLGLGAGLALAYLPDQTSYGPTWERVALVDLAIVAGAFGGIAAATVGNCVEPNVMRGKCAFEDWTTTSRFALVGGALGLAAGWFLTRGDEPVAPSVGSPKREARSSRRSGPRITTLPGALPVLGANGMTVVPGLVATGRF